MVVEAPTRAASVAIGRNRIEIVRGWHFMFSQLTHLIKSAKA